MVTFALALCLSLVSGITTDAEQQQKLAATGEQYLKDLHTRACLELDAADVRSRVVQDKPVCELADPRLTQIFPLLEHGSPPAILGRGLERERNRIYMILATEGAAAYSLKERGGNSHGLFQMTMATYYAMRKGYPAADLPKKFPACAQDHLCSAKFAILYNDANASFLARRMPLQWRDRMHIGTLAHARYLAAAYTAGTLPYRLVMRSRGALSWTDKLPRAQWRRYVKMLERLMHVLDEEAEEST